MRKSKKYIVAGIRALDSFLVRKSNPGTMITPCSKMYSLQISKFPTTTKATALGVVLVLRV